MHLSLEKDNGQNSMASTIEIADFVDGFNAQQKTEEKQDILAYHTEHTRFIIGNKLSKIARIHADVDFKEIRKYTNTTRN